VLAITFSGHFTAYCILYKSSQRDVYSQALCIDRNAAAHTGITAA